MGLIEMGVFALLIVVGIFWALKTKKALHKRMDRIEAKKKEVK